MSQEQPLSWWNQPGLYLREAQLIGRKPITAEQAAANKAAGLRGRRPRAGSKGLLPFSSGKLWLMVKNNEFPAPVRLSERISAWRSEDIARWLREREAATNTGRQP